MSIVGVENKMCRNNLCILPVIVAIILGVVIGVVFFTGIIPIGIITISLALGLIFSIITLILLYIALAFETKKETKECLCEYGRCLALGGFVTLVTGILGVTFAEIIVVGSILSALLIGVFAFGLILNLLSFIGLFVCLINKNCYRKNIYCQFDNNCQ